VSGSQASWQEPHATTPTLVSVGPALGHSAMLRMQHVASSISLLMFVQVRSVWDIRGQKGTRELAFI
jgi:hypothetical protein